jgi:hypothetical protein
VKFNLKTNKPQNFQTNFGEIDKNLMGVRSRVREREDIAEIE